MLPYITIKNNSSSSDNEKRGKSEKHVAGIKKTAKPKG